MKGGVAPKFLIHQIGVLLGLLILETLRYLAFLCNFPLVVSLAGMIVAIAVVLQDTYDIALFELMRRLPFLGSRIPQTWSLDGGDLLWLYAWATFALFVIGETFRFAFGPKRVTRRRRFSTLFVVVTLGWGFVIAHLPILRVAPDTSRTGLGLTFVFFYLLGIGGFAIGAPIHRFVDFLTERISMERR